MPGNPGRGRRRNRRTASELAWCSRLAGSWRALPARLAPCDVAADEVPTELSADIQHEKASGGGIAHEIAGFRSRTDEAGKKSARFQMRMDLTIDRFGPLVPDPWSTQVDRARFGGFCRTIRKPPQRRER